MAHFAKLDANNKVIEIIVVNNEVIYNLPFPESESIGIEFCKSLYGQDTVWKQTSFNSNFRQSYATIGGLYLEEYDCFVSPKPYPSWIYDVNTLMWIPPTPMPSIPEGANPITTFFTWDENTTSWIMRDNPMRDPEIRKQMQEAELNQFLASRNSN